MEGAVMDAAVVGAADRDVSVVIDLNVIILSMKQWLRLVVGGVGLMLLAGGGGVKETEASLFGQVGGGVGGALASSPTPADFGNFEVLDQLLGTSGQGNQISAYVTPGGTPFTNIFNRLIQIVIGLTVLIGVGMVVAGGYLYMTAQGNASQVETGKDFIKTALFAIALAVASVLLLNTISPQFGEDIQEPVLILPSAPPSSPSPAGT